MPSRHLAATAFAAMLAQLDGVAQRPTAWAEQQIASGVAVSAVNGQGKLVTYDAGAELHVFSSVTKRWLTVEKAPTTALKLFNDCALLIEPTRILAISAYFGAVAKQNISPNATLLNSSGAKNDSLALVHDGLELHAFSAFTGSWTTRPVALNASGSVQRHVAVIHSGARLIGVSAFDGEWHETDADAPSSLSADGTAGFAVGASIQAFSAHTRQWTLVPTPANATFARGDDWGVWLGPNNGVAYSGLVGSFSPLAPGIATLTASSDLYAILSTGVDLHAYSAVTGDVIAAGPVASSVDAGSGAAILRDATGVRGYSALRQSSQALSVTAISSGAGANYGHVVDAGGQLHAFSAVTSRWHPAPTTTTGGPPHATTTTVAVETATDCHAFYAKTGQFVALGQAVQGLAANASSAPLLAYDAASLHAFDTEHGRWISTPRTGLTTPTFRIWRTTGLAIDGTSAHGVGAQAGTWHSLDLGASAGASFANSEVAYVVDAQRIIACGMLPEIVSLQQFPHFRRVQPRDAEVAFSTVPLHGSLIFAGFAPPQAPAAIAGLGELHLDPSLATVVMLSSDPVNGVAEVRWSPPSAPILAGATIFAQMIVLPSNGSLPYLSDRASVQLW